MSANKLGFHTAVHDDAMY